QKKPIVDGKESGVVMMDSQLSDDSHSNVEDASTIINTTTLKATRCGMDKGKDTHTSKSTVDVERMNEEDGVNEKTEAEEEKNNGENVSEEDLERNVKDMLRKQPFFRSHEMCAFGDSAT